jgi:transmembrane sensor
MSKEYIWKLLARKMTGEATEEELRELQDMLKGDPEMNYTAETFCRLWNALSVQQTEESETKNIGTNKE